MRRGMYRKLAKGIFENRGRVQDRLGPFLTPLRRVGRKSGKIKQEKDPKQL